MAHHAFAQQARIAKKKQDAPADRKRQKEAEREAKACATRTGTGSPRPAPAPEVPRGLRAHNGIGPAKAPLHARAAAFPCAAISAETPDEEEPQTVKLELNISRDEGLRRVLPLSRRPSAGSERSPAAGGRRPAVERCNGLGARVKNGGDRDASPPRRRRRRGAARRHRVAAGRRRRLANHAPASPLRFDEGSDDDDGAAAKRVAPRDASGNGGGGGAGSAPRRPNASDEDSVVFLGSNAAPAPAFGARRLAPPAPTPAPAPAPEKQGTARDVATASLDGALPPCAAFIVGERRTACSF